MLKANRSAFFLVFFVLPSALSFATRCTRIANPASFNSNISCSQGRPIHGNSCTIYGTYSTEEPVSSGKGDSIG